jgi:hypothetical protein
MDPDLQHCMILFCYSSLLMIIASTVLL